MNYRKFRAGEQPFGDYTINQDSEQANGLRFWWPCWGSWAAGGYAVDLVGGRDLKTPSATAPVLTSWAGQTRSTDGGALIQSGDMFAPCPEYTSAASKFIRQAAFVNSVLPFTMTGWMYSTTDTADNAVISYSVGITERYYRLYANFGASLASITTYDGVSTITADSSGAGTPLVGVWQHYAGVFGTGADSRCYLDGVGGTPGTLGSPATSRITIGSYKTTLGDFSANALIADVRFYNVVKSADEISRMHAAGTRWDLYAPLHRRSTFIMPSGRFASLGGYYKSDTRVVLVG